MSRSLRILAVLNAYPTLSETFLYTTLLAIQESGIAVVVRARRRGEAPHKIPTLRVRYLPREDWPLAVKLLVLLKLLVQLLLSSPRDGLRILQEQVARKREKRLAWRELALTLYRILPLMVSHADVIYLAHGGLGALYLDCMRYRPTVLSLRGSDINIEPLLSDSYRARLRDAILSASAVHCVCEAIRQKAEKLAGSSLPNAKVIYTAVNPMFLEDTPRGSDDATGNRSIQIISVGRLDWRKGLEHGLMAIRELRDRGVSCHWRIVGEGPYRIALQWAIRDLALEDVVTLVGGQDQRSVRDMLAKSDVYFHPAVHEGLSNAVLEAMAVGLPVVVSDVCGMREAVTDGVHGYLVPPRDWRAMADALEKLCNDAALRSRMGGNASEHVRQHFTTARQNAGFVELFAQALRP